jgi:hypothetical protein
MSMKPLRDWAAPSYDPKTGRAASSLGTGESASYDGLRCNPSSQRDAGRTAGEGGAPGFAECDRARTQKHKNFWSER